MPRQEAYVLVQRNAMRAWRGEGRFRELLGADADVAAQLSAERLDELFDLDHALAHVPAIVDRALARMSAQAQAGARAIERGDDRHVAQLQAAHLVGVHGSNRDLGDAKRREGRAATRRSFG